MARRREPKDSERRITAKERQRECLELRKAGLSYQAIADHLGYKSKSTPHDAVMDAIHEIIREPAEDVLALELMRLDELWLPQWAQARKGDPKAMAACVKLMERRAKYLGLDAPTKVENTGKDGEPISVNLIRGS